MLKIEGLARNFKGRNRFTKKGLLILKFVDASLRAIYTVKTK